MNPARKPYSFDVSDEALALVAPYLTLLREDAGQCVPALREVFNGLRCCSVAERRWDAARWAIKAYAWRFDGVRRGAVRRNR